MSLNWSHSRTCLGGQFISRLIAWLTVFLFYIPLAAGWEPPPEKAAQELTAEEREQLRITADALWKKALKLRYGGNPTEALITSLELVRVQEKADGEPNGLIAFYWEWIAELREEMEDFPAAKESREKVLQINVQLYGADHWSAIDARLAVAHTQRLAGLEGEARARLITAESWQNEIESLANAQKFSEALPIALGTIETLRAILGEEHPHFVRAQSNLGWIYRDLGDYERAEPLLVKTLESRRKILGERHLDTAHSLNSLGWVYENRRDFQSAERCFKEAAEICKKTFGESNLTYALSLDNLGRLHFAKREYSTAEPLYRQALEIRKKVRGEEHPDYANSLDNLGRLYDITGEYAKAETLYRQVLEIRKKALGEEHPDYASILCTLGLFYYTTGVYARAEPLYVQALEIYKKTLGEEHRSYATTLCNLGLLYTTIGDYVRADLRYHQALEIRRKTLGERHPDYAWSLHNLAALYTHTSDFRRAEPLYHEANKIRKDVLGEAHPDYAFGLNNLAGFYVQAANYAGAEPLFRQAIEIRKKALGEAHPLYATSVNDLAGLYVSMGDFAQAETLHRESLEIREHSLGKAHPEYAASLNNLASLYKEMGDYTRAEPRYRQALEVRKAALGGAHPDYAQSLNNMANLYQEMGDYAKAELLFRQALEIRGKALGEEHPYYGISLNNLALFYKLMGDYARAEPLFHQALEIDKRTYGERHPEYATTQMNLADLYKSMGDFAKAEPLYREAMETDRRTFGEEHLEYANDLSMLARLYDAMGDYEQAKNCCERAREIKRKRLGEQHPDYAHSLNRLAGLYETLGDIAQAEPLYHQALRISHKSLDLAAVIQSERQQLAMLANTRYQLDSLVSMASQAPRTASRSYDEVLAFKGLVLGRQRAMRAAAAKPETAAVLEELRTMASRLATLSFAAPSPHQAQAWKETIAQLSAQKEELEKKLAAGSQEYRDALKPVTLAGLRAALPDGAALVDFLQFSHWSPKSKEQGRGWQREERLGVFIVRREGDVRFVDLGSAKEISVAIKAWRRGHGQSFEAQEAARTLHKQVWLPIEQYLTGVKTVLICPDQDVSKLPFAALPGKAPGTYLLQELTLAVIPAPQAIMWLEENPFAKDRLDSLLVLGGVNYDRVMGLPMPEPVKFAVRGIAPRSDAGGAFQPLPGAQKEMSAIGGLYKETHGSAAATMIEGGEASQDAVVQAARNHRYLHLATHGYFAAERFKSAMDRDFNEVQSGGSTFVGNQSIAGYHPGLLSGLALAGANEPTDEDDGILTAAEVESLNLGKVDLVVLSACETGLGNAAGGEGLLGLQRAFQVAGARTVVASLWSVPDQATRLLMVRFYENLWKKKMGKLEALREAQLWMMKHGAEQPEIRSELEARGLAAAGNDREADASRSPKGLPPYYWGAWVLSGDWR